MYLFQPFIFLVAALGKKQFGLGNLALGRSGISGGDTGCHFVFLSSVSSISTSTMWHEHMHLTSYFSMRLPSSGVLSLGSGTLH